MEPVGSSSKQTGFDTHGASRYAPAPTIAPPVLSPMQTPATTPSLRVLVVDSSEETHAVLQTALSRRGVEVFAAERAEQGLAMAREHRPQLIVLDLEVAERSPGASSTEWEAAFEAETADATLVVIGAVRRKDAPRLSEQFVAKPYHYAPLIRRIEALLDRPARARHAA